MVIMNVENISFEIDNNQIFDNLSFSIESGTINAFISSNNSCKTTLIKMLSGVIYNNCGKICVNNITLNNRNFKKYTINISTILSDLDNQFMCDKVEDEIKYILKNLKYTKKDSEKNYCYVVNLLKINNLVDKKTCELSVIEKIKVLLASSIIHKPKILLIDDLLRFLNSNERKEVLELFNVIVNNLNTSIIFTTSNLLDVINLSNIYVLKAGKIIMNNSYENIILNDNDLSKAGIEIPLMIDLSRKLEFYGLVNKIYYDRDEVINVLWK